MSLSGTTCGTEIVTALQDAGYIPADSGDAEAIWQEIMTVIFDHFRANDDHTHTDSQGGTTSPPVY